MAYLVNLSESPRTYRLLVNDRAIGTLSPSKFIVAGSTPSEEVHVASARQNRSSVSGNKEDIEAVIPFVPYDAPPPQATES